MNHQQLTQDEQSAKACTMGFRLFAPIVTMGAFSSLWSCIRRKRNGKPNNWISYQR